MSKKILAQNCEVVIGVDVHTDSHVIAVRRDKDIIERHSMRGSREDWANYLRRLPGCVIRVVYESGPNGYNLYDILDKLNGEEERQIHVYMAPPSMIPEAPGKRRVKTDRRDAVKLIQAYETGSFRPIVVPDEEKRACRQLVRQRQKMKDRANRLKNSIHGMIKFYGLEYPETDKWSGEWMKDILRQARKKDRTGHIEFSLKMEFKLLQTTTELQKEAEKRMEKLFRSKNKIELAQTLRRQTGIGPVTAAVIATEVADFHAFDNSDAFASYTGLVSGAWGTGKIMHLGPITKVGNRRLRWALVESAWTWVRYDKAAKLKFEALKAKRGARRAIVAMARRLAVRLWHMVVHNAPPTPATCRD